MNHPDESALGDGLAALETLKRKGRPPGRWDARAVLVPLGRLLLSRGEEALEGELERLRASVSGCAEAWREAVDQELALACAEHVESVNPAYLDLPNYDFEYVVQARERLEARLVAARILGFAGPEALLGQVAQADERLRPYLQRG